ncbi:amidohydrolase family protein [Herbaspirillum sp.]|uniref:amidohydrolase family protein n=1 Tax=Herbaspirillum sp. TaxID=1890675 RepID=UPI0031D9BA95
MTEHNTPQPMARCACGVDIHAHVVPHAFPRYLGSAAPAQWPAMAPAHACHQHVMISGKIYRTVSDRCWDLPKRLVDLDECGINVQAISPMPELLSYWMEAAPAQQLLRYINEEMAQMVDHSGGRMVALGAVPLQDMDLAIAELRYLIEELGFAGVEMGSNINGRPIGDPVLAPFFEAAHALDAAIFVHAVKPVGMDRLVGPAQLQQVLAYPSDVGLAAASVITSGLLARYPGLKLAFSHGGGTLASLLPRLSQAHQVFPALAESMAAPREVARQLYYDTLVFDAPTLRHLADSFGVEGMMIGTDYPFAFRDKSPVDSVQQAFADPDVREKILHLNAMRFLGIQRH